MANSIYDFSVAAPGGKTKSLAEFKGRVLLVVNTASKCGFTPQLDGLEKLQKEFGPKGFDVLAFPCNQFGGQEPGSETEIEQFCTLNYKTSFPIFSKIEVNGASADPLYTYLKSSKPGLFGTEAIKWNFTKFLIGRDGQPVARFAPNDKPEDIAKQIAELL